MDYQSGYQVPIHRGLFGSNDFFCSKTLARFAQEACRWGQWLPKQLLAFPYSSSQLFAA
jgi:hypothetical protein